MKKFTFLTGNINKQKEIAKILNSNIDFIDLDLIEIQDVNIENVVKHKAIEAFNYMQRPIIIEDTSLIINNWNGLPGPLIKWFLKTIGNKGILKMLMNFESRDAEAITYLAYYTGEKVIYYKGSIEGTISKTELGENGFGWDTIFIPNGSNLAFAQMEEDEKNKFSMRKLALEELMNNEL
jgi:non-canonical purine NTP pyrophosphatase (RdgB/HAM1 family)